MAKVTIEHPHTLSHDEVKKRLDTLNGRLSSKYGIDATWKSDTQATFKGMGASGTIQCHPDKVVVNVQLSLLLSPVKSKVESRIRQELATALAASPAAGA